MRLWVAFFALSLFSGVAFAEEPSFDCGRATTSREHAVCGSAVLSALDRELAAAFSTRKSHLPEPDRQRLVVEQRGWLKQAQDRCGSDEGSPQEPCFAALYKTRIAELNGPISVAGVTVVTDEKQSKWYVDELQKSLASQSPQSRITSCDVVVRTNEDTGHDDIYGGSCMVSVDGKKEMRLVMCDDYMVNKFTTTNKYFYGASLDVIGTFLRTNCPAGG